MAKVSFGLQNCNTSRVPVTKFTDSNGELGRPDFGQISLVQFHLTIDHNNMWFYRKVQKPHSVHIT